MMNTQARWSFVSAVILAALCGVAAPITDARAEGPDDAERVLTAVSFDVDTASGPGGFTIDRATLSQGGAVFADGSIYVLGQTVTGTASSASFTLEVGIVPVMTAGSTTVACPASSMPVAELIGLDVSTKNRFLSFAAGDAPMTQGVRVTFDSLPPPFEFWSGAELWVGPTSQVSEAGANILPTPGFPSFTAATLRCTPFYTDWSSLGTVHVFHEGIVPGGSYRVDVIGETCDAGVATNFSAALPMTTAIWGDTVLDLSVDPPPPPGGPPVGIDDALAILEGFSSVPGAIIKARADLEPACLDLKINVTDVLSSLSGFSGLSYPFTPTAADPCNSTCPNVLP